MARAPQSNESVVAQKIEEALRDATIQFKRKNNVKADIFVFDSQIRHEKRKAIVFELYRSNLEIAGYITVARGGLSGLNQDETGVSVFNQKRETPRIVPMWTSRNSAGTPEEIDAVNNISGFVSRIKDELNLG